MKITTYEYEKVPVKETEIFIPDKPFYCFQTFIRRAIRIVPTFITWEPSSGSSKKGDVYELEVTCVYQSMECVVEKFNVRISDIEDFINREEKGKSAEISRMLLDEDYYERTEEQFNEDLECALESFKK